MREAAMIALEQIVPLVLARDATHTGGGGGPVRDEEVMQVSDANGPWLGADMCKALVDALLKQLCEKIDRIRTRAGAVLLGLLHHQPELPGIPHRALLERVLANAAQPALPVDWTSPSESFPRLVQLVQEPEYTRAAVEGLVISIGGLSEGLVKHSWDALLQLLQVKGSRDMRLRVASTLTVILDSCKGTCVGEEPGGVGFGRLG